MHTGVCVYMYIDIYKYVTYTHISLSLALSLSLPGLPFAAASPAVLLCDSLSVSISLPFFLCLSGVV